MLELSIVGLEAVLSGFDGMLQRSNNLRPLLLEIGEDLTDSTKQRFVTTTAPDGTQWAKNSDVTLAHKSGSRPLTDGGFLADSIKPVLIGDDTVQVAPDKVYAATMQFGAQKGQYGVTKHNTPIPWGDIPARPYIGFSDADEQHILDLALAYLL